MVEKTSFETAEQKAKIIWQTPHFNVVIGLLAAVEGDRPELRRSYVVMDREHGVVVGIYRTQARAFLGAVESEGEYIGAERMREEVEARGFQPMVDETPPKKNGH